VERLWCPDQAARLPPTPLAGGGLVDATGLTTHVAGETAALRVPSFTAMSSPPTLARATNLGWTQHRLLVGDLALLETDYQPHQATAPHTHAEPYFSLVLQGRFQERVGAAEREYGAGTAIYRPAHQVHQQRFGTAGARCFTIDLPRDWLTRYGDRRSGEIELAGSAAPEWLTRLHREFRDPDMVTELAVEGLALCLLSEVLRLPRERRAPRWLTMAREILDHEYQTSSRLAELGARLGVHPAHLARTFRAVYGCGVAEYVRRKRLEEVSREILTTDLPLSQIAAAHGFVDQSHLGRWFRRIYGISPARYRRAGRTKKLDRYQP
jgi:AraC family transcriptional regulator